MFSTSQTSTWTKKFLALKEKKSQQRREQETKEIQEKYVEYKRIINALSADEQLVLIKEQPFLVKYIDEPTVEMQRHIFEIDAYGIGLLEKVNKDLEDEFLEIIKEEYKDEYNDIRASDVKLSPEGKKQIIQMICLSGRYNNFEDYFAAVHSALFGTGYGMTINIGIELFECDELLKYAKVLWDMCDIVEK